MPAGVGMPSGERASNLCLVSMHIDGSQDVSICHCSSQAGEAAGSSVCTWNLGRIGCWRLVPR